MACDKCNTKSRMQSCANLHLTATIFIGSAFLHSSRFSINQLPVSNSNSCKRTASPILVQILGQQVQLLFEEE